MNSFEQTLRQVSAVLGQCRFRWALVGGWAVSIRAEPRFTRDLDLAVSVSGDAEAEALVREFRAAGLEISAIVEQDSVQRLATARLTSTSGDGVLLDLLFASSGIEEEICANAEYLEILSGLIVPVALPEHLLALKVLSRDDRARPQDAVDIQRLLGILDSSRIEKARNALSLITQRGYSRGRDLIRMLNDTLAS